MTSLSEVCDDFQTGLEALEPADADLSLRIRGLVTRLVRDAAEHVADYGMGEIPALLHRSREVLFRARGRGRGCRRSPAPLQV